MVSANKVREPIFEDCAKRDSIACNQGAELGSLAVPLQRVPPLGPKTATPPTGSLRLNFRVARHLVLMRRPLAFLCTLAYREPFKVWRPTARKLEQNEQFSDVLVARSL
jgi:hypothetical protein